MTERVFKALDRNGVICEFELKVPSLAEENEGERQYRIAYSKSLVEGIFPREKLREIMREHNMWTETDDKEFKKTVGKIAVLQVELHKSEAEGNEKACMEAARGIADARKRMWELFLVQQSVYMNSAEGIAELIKTEAVMAACTIVKATSQRYWKDYTEYVRERDFNNKSSVYSNLIGVQSKILDDARHGIMADYPEHRYLKTAQERVLDREIEEEVLKEISARTKKKKRAKKLETSTKEPGKSNPNSSQ